MNMRSAAVASIVGLVVVLMSGCAATIKRDAAETHRAVHIPVVDTSRLVLNVDGSHDSTTSSDWEGFKNEWRDNFTEQAMRAGIAFEMQDGAARPTGQEGTLLSVYIEDYRYFRPATRYLVGVMAGNAYIESRLTYTSLKTGETYGSQTANTSSSAWEGVFSAMTNRQVEAIAIDVVKQMKAGPP